MAWNGRNGTGTQSGAGAKKPAGTPGWKRGALAGLLVVAVGVVVLLLLLPKGGRTGGEAKEKKTAAIREVAPDLAKPAPKPAERAATNIAEKAGQKPDTNIVWVGKTRYVTKMHNGKSVTVYAGNPDEPPSVPTFKSGLNNFLVNFITPGEFFPPTPFSFTQDAVMEALMEKIEIDEEQDDETVRYEKEGVALVREQLREYIKEGRSVEEFIEDLQQRQAKEAAYVQDAKGMIMKSAAENSPEETLELVEALNKHLHEKGLPNVKLPNPIRRKLEAAIEKGKN